MKNFSLIQTSTGDYILSPAYDLLCTSMHLPNESRMALNLFDSYESEFFIKPGFYGRNDFMELANRFGISERRSDTILSLSTKKLRQVEQLTKNSFLSSAAKREYLRRFNDRLRAITQ